MTGTVRCSAVTRQGKLCRRDASHLVVWGTGGFGSGQGREHRPSCLQHVECYFASTETKVVELPSNWRTGLPDLAERVREGRCVISLDHRSKAHPFLDWCVTHDVGADFIHYLDNHAAVTPAGYAAND